MKDKTTFNHTSLVLMMKLLGCERTYNELTGDIEWYAPGTHAVMLIHNASDNNYLLSGFYNLYDKRNAIIKSPLEAYNRISKHIKG